MPLVFHFRGNPGFLCPEPKIRFTRLALRPGPAPVKAPGTYKIFYLKLDVASAADIRYAGQVSRRE